MHTKVVSPHSENINGFSSGNGNGVVLYDAPVYLHTSTFLSRNLELRIRSPRIKYVEDPKFSGRKIPVFSGKDSIGGTVLTVIPALISSEHQLVISIEGAFFWIGPQREEPQMLPPSPLLPERIKHVFLSSSVTIPLLPSALSSPSGPPAFGVRSLLSEGIHKSLFRRRKRLSKRWTESTRTDKSSEASKDQFHGKTYHSFSFPLPIVDSREVPSTISVSRLCAGGLRGRWYAEGAQVAYKLSLHVQPIPTMQMVTNSTPTSTRADIEERLETPILIESINDEEESGSLHETWSQVDLTNDIPLDFKCMLSLPQPASFLRSGKIAFYVFFATSPQTDVLAREIMKNAIIRVSLIRQLRLDTGIVIHAPIPRTRLSDESPHPMKKQPKPSAALLRRVASHTPKIFKWHRESEGRARAGTRINTPQAGVSSKVPSIRDKALPPLPAPPNKSSKLYEDVICSLTSEGFPKRVTRKEASLHDAQSTPNGFFKGELSLSNELANTINWPGISLSYFVEASVFFRNNVVRARRPVRLEEAYLPH
ncbi:hypothetical protein K439DRAFT_998340 [Ramaria rubella]|nr:hypothetical protein K439DRAFT_998340 [Ramaria rubella]